MNNDKSRAAALAFVVAAHFAPVWIICRHSSVSTEFSSVAPLTFISLSASKQAVKVTTLIDLRALPAYRIDIERPLWVLLDGAKPTDPNMQRNGRITPPAPIDTVLDTTSFVQQAGLQKGSGVTVVLRVEVRGSGEVARVAVEVSGGAPKVDEAAIAYVRAIKWTGGLKDDKPETLWVRWGVRLDG